VPDILKMSANKQATFQGSGFERTNQTVGRKTILIEFIFQAKQADKFILDEQSKPEEKEIFSQLSLW